MTYIARSFEDLVELTSQAKSKSDIMLAHVETNFAALDGAITVTQESKLSYARAAMRKALNCRTHEAVSRLIWAYEELGLHLFSGDANESLNFFSDVLQPRKHRLYLDKNWDKIRADLNVIFKNKPKLSAVIIDGRLLEGRPQ